MHSSIQIKLPCAVGRRPAPPNAPRARCARRARVPAHCARSGRARAPSPNEQHSRFSILYDL